MLTREEILNQWIPHRLQAIDMLEFAWSLHREGESQRDVQILVNGNVRVRTTVPFITNPMIEIGILHARALLEFLGLSAKKGKLIQVAKRRQDDFGIEHCSSGTTLFRLVTPAEALEIPSVNKEDAERAFVAIWEWANKGIAHSTTGELSERYSEKHLSLGCLGIRTLLQTHLYAKIDELNSLPRFSQAPSSIQQQSVDGEKIKA